MAVRDTDDIIGQEKLRRIAEKRAEDKKTLNAVLMMYQAKAEEEQKRQLAEAEAEARRLREPVPTAKEDVPEEEKKEEHRHFFARNKSEEVKEEVKPSETVVETTTETPKEEKKATPNLSELTPLNSDGYTPIEKDKYTPLTQEALKEMTKAKRGEDKKAMSSILSMFKTKSVLQKRKTQKAGSSLKTIASYEQEQLYEALNHKEETLTQAEKDEITKRRIEQSKGFEVTQAKKPYAKEPPKWQKHIGWFVYAGIILIIAIYMGMVSTSYKQTVQQEVVATSGFGGEVVKDSTPQISPLQAMFKGITKDNLKITMKGFDGKFFFIPFLIVVGVGVAVGLLIWANNSEKKRMRVGHEHGLKRIATKQDMAFFKKQFMDKTPKNNLLFSRNIGLSLDNTFSGRTANVLIIGGTGTGKTFKYVKPNILQQNCSMVITDPSGDIFDSFSGYLLDQGFNVYIFNVKDLELSNYYNPLMNVYDARGEINEVKVDVLVDLYMKNAKNGQEAGGSDPFWDKSEKAFLTALVYYVLENDDIEPVDKCFNTILKKAQDAKAEAEGGKKSTETKLTTEIKSWQKEMEARGRKIKTPLYYDTFLIAPDKTANTILITTAVDLQLFATKEVDRITRVNEQYPDFNIDFDTIAQLQSYVFLCIPQQHQAYNFLISMFYSQLYGRLYEYGEAIARNQYFIEAEWGIPLFKGFDSFEEAEDFRLHATKDDIVEVDYINNTKIYKIAWGEGDKKKVYRTVFNKEALLRLLDNLGHTKVMKQADMFHGDPALPIHCNFLLDEFKNIGEIPNFLTTLSTSRKYRIGSHVIIQDVGQIKTMYKEEEHQTLIANVDTIIFLGSSLPEDKKYIQEALGKTTILQKSVSSSKTGNSTSYTPTEVDLMSIDEIAAINDPQKKRDDCIVIIRDFHPFVDHKYFLFDHPNWKKVQDYKKRNKEMHFNPNLYYLNNAENEIYSN